MPEPSSSNLSPPSPRVIVLEQSPRWESELLRRFPHAGSRLRTCRDAADVLKLLTDNPADLLLVTLATSAGPQSGGNILHLVAGIRTEYPHIEIVVVWSGPEHALEWSLREQGIQYFLKDTHSTAETIAGLCAPLLAGWSHDIAALLPPESRW
ncbi:MAG: hypothetical protein U0903_18005 [Planctomycetales bacterium]